MFRTSLKTYDGPFFRKYMFKVNSKVARTRSLNVVFLFFYLTLRRYSDALLGPFQTSLGENFAAFRKKLHHRSLRLETAQV